jgi:hypothetical protein
MRIHAHASIKMHRLLNRRTPPAPPPSKAACTTPDTPLLAHSCPPARSPAPCHCHVTATLHQRRLLQRPPKRCLKPWRVLRRLPLPWRQLPMHLTAHNDGVQPETHRYTRSYGRIHLITLYVRRSSSASPTVSNDDPGASPNYPIAPCLPPLPPLCTTSLPQCPTHQTRLPRHRRCIRHQ